MRDKKKIIHFLTVVKNSFMKTPPLLYGIDEVNHLLYAGIPRAVFVNQAGGGFPEGFLVYVLHKGDTHCVLGFLGGFLDGDFG